MGAKSAQHAASVEKEPKSKYECFTYKYHKVRPTQRPIDTSEENTEFYLSRLDDAIICKGKYNNFTVQVNSLRMPTFSGRH